MLERAWAAGVQRIVITGGSLEDSRAALALARTDRAHPGTCAVRACKLHSPVHSTAAAHTCGPDVSPIEPR